MKCVALHCVLLDSGWFSIVYLTQIVYIALILVHRFHNSNLHKKTPLEDASHELIKRLEFQRDIIVRGKACLGFPAWNRGFL